MPAEAIAPIIIPAFLALVFLYAGWQMHRNADPSARDGRVPLRRGKSSVGTSALVQQLFLVAFLAFSYSREEWTPESVGLSSRFGVAPALLFGFSCFGILLWPSAASPVV